MPKFLESAYRLDTFRPDSVPIVMGDGQEWHLPKPWVSYRPMFDPTGKLGAMARTTLGADFDEAFDEAKDAETDYDYIVAIMKLGAAMLAINYQTTPELLADVLRFTPGDPTNDEMWTAIYSVSQGLDAPKRSSDIGVSA